MQEPRLTENSLRILKSRYLQKDPEGNIIETPGELFQRVAKFAANSPEQEKEFFEAMCNLDFMPNSPVLFNFGRKNGHPLGSACFVLVPEDSIDSIFNTLNDAAQLLRWGAGVGFSFSKIRSEGSYIKSTGGNSTGPLPYIFVYNELANAIKQGSYRRSALMGILDVSHPDIEKFIAAKFEDGRLENFNISVAVTDKFMQAVKKKKKFWLVDPSSNEKIKEIDAAKLFDSICKYAHRSGDPGMFFIDEVNRYNPTEERLISTNPCGEQSLLSGESCNLIALNLNNYYKDKFDWERFKQSIRIAVRFGDNVVGKQYYPIKLAQEKTLATRKVGLGIMGLADLFIHKKIKYNSTQAVKFCEDIYEELALISWDESAELAKKFGTFPKYDKKIMIELLKKYRAKSQVSKLRWDDLIKKVEEYGLRNAQTTNQQPCGSVSLISNECSSGIEPVFAFEYLRKDKVGTYTVKHHLAEKFFKENTKAKNLPDYFVDAHHIEPEWHLKMQAVAQKFASNAISKTINMSNSATVEDIKKIYLAAHDSRCKGITVFRDGCKSQQVLNRVDQNPIPKPIPRPKKTEGITDRIELQNGKLYVTINHDKGHPIETILNIGKSGTDLNAMTEAVGRLISVCLKYNIPIVNVIKQLKGIGGSTKHREKDKTYSSIPDAIAKSLEEFLNTKVEEKKDQNFDIECPSCSSKVIFAEGCMKCDSCGWSKC